MLTHNRIFIIIAFVFAMALTSCKQELEFVDYKSGNAEVSRSGDNLLPRTALPSRTCPTTGAVPVANSPNPSSIKRKVKQIPPNRKTAKCESYTLSGFWW